ncbi:MAG: glycosyltransferase family 4 protein [Fimbriimonadales bacterium]|nr:glycosyltransferase family 4 protein [Fimbriimonadales bacterium]
MERFWVSLGTTHVLSEYLDVGPTYIALAKERGLRWFSFGHGYDVSRSLRNPLWRRLFLEHRHADGVFVRSSLARRRLEQLGLPPERIHVTPGGVIVPDLPPSRERGSQDPPVVLTVGRLVGKKDVCTLIESFGRVLRSTGRGAQLVVIGDGPDRARAQRLARNLGIEAHVRFLGSQPREVVREWMQRADIFALHSRTDPRTGDEEGLPTVILEAMAAGLPVVSTLHAGIPEAVVSGETGLLGEEGDATATAQALAELCSNDRLRLRMGSAAFERARRLFSWEAERRRILEPMGLLAD